MSRRPFTLFEVEKVAEYRTGYDDAFAEPIHSDDDQAHADEEASGQYWTVYGYRPHENEDGTMPDDGGAQAIFDGEEQDVIDLAYALADGKPVFIRGTEVPNA